MPISDTFLSQHFLFFDIIGAKSKAQKHAFWPALCSAACGGAVRRCAAPSAAARCTAGASRRPSGALRAQRAARAPCYEHEGCSVPSVYINFKRKKKPLFARPGGPTAVAAVAPRQPAVDS
eukprot:scaffold11625_cov53-Phaeocystis_antarctica.AAC.2